MLATPPATTATPAKPAKEDEDMMLWRMAEAAIGLSTQQEKLATFMRKKGVDFQ